MPKFSENFRQSGTLNWQANYKYHIIRTRVQVSFLSAGILDDQYFTANTIHEKSVSIGM